MRLLFVHEVDWLEKVRYEIHELPEQLSLLGHEVDFIDFPERAARSSKRRFTGFRTVERTIDSHTYPASRVRLFSPGRIFPSPLDRLVATITFLPALISILRKHRYDAIVLYSVPTNGWQTVIVARLMGIPIMFRALDVSHLIRKTRFRRLVVIAERFVYRRVDWLSANNSELLAYCIDNGASASRSSTNFPGLQLEDFMRTSPSLALRSRLKILDSQKVFVFLGTLFPFCGLDRVLADFVKKDGRFLHTKLLILGDGYLLKQLQETVRSYQIDSQVIFLGRVEYEQLGDFLNLADVAAMPFNSEKVSELALPWKVVQYIAAGLPVVATPLKGLLSAFPPGEGVRYAKPSDNFVEEMYDLACNKEKSDELVSRGLQRIRSRFLWDTNVVEFERLIQDVSLSPNKRKR